MMSVKRGWQDEKKELSGADQGSLRIARNKDLTVSRIRSNWPNKAQRREYDPMIIIREKRGRLLPIVPTVRSEHLSGRPTPS